VQQYSDNEEDQCEGRVEAIQKVSKSHVLDGLRGGMRLEVDMYRK